jgi:hypothetical protein
LDQRALSTAHAKSGLSHESFVCSALVGIVEAVQFLGKRLDELDVCSIGTTYAADSVKKLAGAGLFGWGPRVVSLIMNAQVDATLLSCNKQNKNLLTNYSLASRYLQAPGKTISQQPLASLAS